MALQLRQAQRKKAYLKLGISAPSGGGKTLGALLIAYGLMKEKYPDKDDDFRWSKIAIIDTENGSGELYQGMYIESCNTQIGIYNALTLDPPYEAQKYINAIEVCEDAEMEVCIIDSSTHLWSGEGGLLDQQSSISKRTNNSWTAWRDITPMHQHFVEKMLHTPMHIIATMRAKQEYVQDKDQNGKTTVKKLGLEPEQRKGMEYEFTTFFEISEDHTAFGSKDRTNTFDQKSFKITPLTGEMMMRWLEGGSVKEDVVVATGTHKANKEEAIAKVKAEIIDLCKTLGGSKDAELMEVVRRYAPNGNPNSITDETQLSELRSELLQLETRRAIGKKEIPEEVEVPEADIEA